MASMKPVVKSVVDLTVGDDVTNLGQVVGVCEHGAFVTCAIKQRTWSLVDGLPHENIIDRVWHSAEVVMVEVWV